MLTKTPALQFLEIPRNTMKSQAGLRVSAVFCYFLLCFRVRRKGTKTSGEENVGLPLLGLMPTVWDTDSVHA